MIEAEELQGWGKDHHRLVMDEMTLKEKQVELVLNLIL